MTNSRTRFINSMLATGTIAAIGIVGAAMPANAADPAKNSQGQCLADPSRWSTTNFGEVSHLDTKVTPGTEEVSHLEQRWSRLNPGVEQIQHEETKYQRTIPGVAEVSHDQWRYFSFVPGVNESSHTEGQFTRQNPGQQEQSHQEYKYSKQVPPVLETKYKKPVMGVEYQYQKFVKGIVQVKQGYQWVSAGSTFDWEIYPSNPPKWSTDNKSVLEAGGHNSVVSEWNDRGRQYRKVTTNYQYQNTGQTRPVNTGQFEFGWFESNPGSPWVSTGATQTKTPGYTAYYNNGNWTTDTPGAPWVKIDEQKVIDQNFVAPFTEYRAQDGSATTDVNNAGWFPEDSFPGWSPYGTRKTVIDQIAVPDQTFYLTRDAQGNLGQSTDEDDASWFTSTEGIEPKWVEFDREKVVDSEAIPEKTVYLAGISDDGTVTESDNPLDAAWIDTNESVDGLTIWQQMVDAFGDPLVNVVIDQEAIPAFTEYYVSNGEPTSELGESNWTTDKPEGWTFVDDRKVVTKEATPPVTTVIKVVDKEAWTENKLVPATYTVCASGKPNELAETGSNPWGPAGFAGLLILGGAAVVVATRRGRHAANPEMNVS